MATAKVNDIEIAYDLAGSGENFVLLHGGQTDRSVYNAVLPTLTENFRVLNFDQRGMGKTSKPDIPYSMAMIADDTAGLMDHVGFDRAYIFGTSMGGMIAQEFGLRHPEKTAALIIGCAVTGGPHPLGLGSNDSKKAFSTEELSAEERAKALATSIFTEGYVNAHPEIIPALVESREKNPLDPVAFGRRLDAGYAHDTYDRLPKISCPTLVMVGKDDEIIPWENSKVIAERIPGAQLVVLEPAGHGFWIEQTEQTCEAILKFLAGI